MKAKRFKTVGMGELLWDLLPNGKQLGGAPANFAYITTLLGNQGLAVSRVGNDDLGKEAIRRLTQLGVSTTFIQSDVRYPTGRVNVEVDSSGQPRFEICSSVAWDFLEWTPQWRKLAEEADAVCFGSLAQRSEASRSTICNFLDATRPEAVRVFDVNLRQSFYTPLVLSASMKRAGIVKLNHEELPTVMRLFGLEHRDEESSARRLISAFDLKLLCVTRGNAGSLLVSQDGCNQHSGFRIKVADTIGAGDAFTAALVHEYFRGGSLERMNAVANRVGAWVASEVGGMPVPTPGRIEEMVSQITDA
jgi:fructokinase